MLWLGLTWLSQAFWTFLEAIVGRSKRKRGKDRMDMQTLGDDDPRLALHQRELPPPTSQPNPPENQTRLYGQKITGFQSAPQPPSYPAPRGGLYTPSSGGYTPYQYSSYRRTRDNPVLKFTPYAWAKLIYMRDKGNTEISGFGVAGNREKLLEITDFVLLPQVCNSVNTKFEGDAIGEYVEDMFDKGFHPLQCMRVWIHTHPGASPQPSGTDEETLSENFGNVDWSIMFIIAREGKTYCRLRYNHMPKSASCPELDIELKDEIGWGQAFKGSDLAAWDEEYNRCVKTHVYIAPSGGRGGNNSWVPGGYGYGGYYDSYDRPVSGVTEVRQQSPGPYRAPGVTGEPPLTPTEIQKTAEQELAEEVARAVQDWNKQDVGQQQDVELDAQLQQSAENDAVQNNPTLPAIVGSAEDTVVIDPHKLLEEEARSAASGNSDNGTPTVLPGSLGRDYDFIATD